VKRFPFLDWMRGLAVVIMIQCHTFNSFSRMDLRTGGPYVLSQFVGGMAAPLFLFMAGMTLAFQMDSLERREPSPWNRWLISLRRAGYVMLIAFAFRITNFIASLPSADSQEITRVDILNSMALALGAFAVVAIFDCKNRVRYAAIGALAVAALSPLVANWNWSGVPMLVQEYLAPGPGRGRFPFFPCAAYVGFGLAIGAILKSTAADRVDRLMQWSVLAGFGLIFGAQYFSNLPYSIYANSDFWRNSPSLILIRVGISLVMLAGAYLWTEHFASARWSWMQSLGKTSLLVYWVHVMLVYGNIVKHFKRSMTIPDTVLSTFAVIALMVGLSAARLAWKARKMERWRAETAVAGAQA
jgi:uncharacterized membrane protein